MEQINPKYFEHVVSIINDGKIFESFAQEFLCAVLGSDLIPVGGIHDLGIDAMLWEANKNEDYRIIYQISIDESASKIYNTLDKLQKNNIIFDELRFVTNGIITQHDKLRTEAFKKYHVMLQTYDLKWLCGQISDERCARVFNSFLDRYYYEFEQIGKTRIIQDFDGDPRIFIFLRQQLDNADSIDKLQDFVLDSIIIFALEGTDPDKNIFLTKQKIFDKIKGIVPVRIDEELFTKRLDFLSTKPRKINHHAKEDAYCLPYQTRKTIQECNLHDEAMLMCFRKCIKERLPEYQMGDCFTADEITENIIFVFNNIFKNSGYEFSSFVLNNRPSQRITQDLPSIITSVVAEKLKTQTKQKQELLCELLFRIIRTIIYSPKDEEKNYLSALSKTYMTLFMLQAEPKVAQYLQTVANKLEVYVCSSILIPALAEIRAPEKNRRLWNLLRMARTAGVKFYINTSILEEIVQHIENKIREYETYYAGNESLYTDREIISHIDSIIIRGFFYHRLSNPQLSFYRYVDEFVDPNAKWSMKKQELKEFLKNEFGIDFSSREQDLLTKIDEGELKLLTDNLEKLKPTRQQALNDAKTILMIYTKRNVDGEDSDCGVLGYRSWWLSTDTTTFAAVEKCLGHNYGTSCYIRPDFLLNFITLSPQKREIENAYDNIFPNTLGISLSRHIDNGFTKAIGQCIKQYDEYKLSRIRTIIHRKIDQLKAEFQQRGSRGLKHYMDNLFSANEDVIP
ncbi:MAG: hypothetical protein MJ033_01780 [Victivallaceae bacterium]|nr:hypothetical protein [Victivallaceae bacterium]